MYFPENVYKGRCDELVSLMELKQIDSVIIPPGPNFFYLTGMETESMERLTVLIVTRKNCSILCPKLMEDQIIEETWVNQTQTWNDGENPYKILREIVGRPNSIYVDGNMPFFHLDYLMKTFNVTFENSDPMLNQLRFVKEELELSLIREATRLSEKSLKEILNELREGITEKQFAKRLEDRFVENSLDGTAFPSIVAFGKNSAVPHHSPDNTALKRGDPIVIDYGGKLKGYSSDNTRTFILGESNKKFETIFNSVKMANEQTREIINGETTYSEMDQTARNIIQKDGFGKEFIHRLGHGLGISVHEPPYLIPENNSKVVTNSVFTIEPGIYIRDMGGVRIEDTNYFNGKKCVPFNSMSRELMVL